CRRRRVAHRRRRRDTAPHLAKLRDDIGKHRVCIPKGRRLLPRYRQKCPIKLVLCCARHFHLSARRPAGFSAASACSRIRNPSTCRALNSPKLVPPSRRRTRKSSTSPSLSAVMYDLGQLSVATV